MTTDLKFSSGAETVLQATSLCKLYSRNRKSTRKRLAGLALRALLFLKPKPISKLYPSEFWAVNDVSFVLRRGEALGIIGLNGSGKTTTLRLLAGQIVPDGGEIWVSGRTAAMIDLQAGFQPGASGRENVYLRAAALGFKRAQTKEKYDEIVEFSELGNAIDAPLATYSAGMKMRLAFAIMITVSPDVLFIDEVLAVGDFQFRQKCLIKVRELREKSAFVLVSHSMADISRFCDRVILMHEGQAIFEGEPDQAIARYEALEFKEKPSSEHLNSVIPAEVVRPDIISDLEVRWLDVNGKTSDQFVEGDSAKISVSFRVAYSPKHLVVGIPVYTMGGDVLTGFATDALGQSVEANAGDRVSVEFEIGDLVLTPGRYRTAIGITDGPEFLHMSELAEIAITPIGRKTWGVAAIPYESRYALNDQND